jgi:hypothetical protein
MAQTIPIDATKKPVQNQAVVERFWQSCDSCHLRRFGRTAAVRKKP